MERTTTDNEPKSIGLSPNEVWKQAELEGEHVKIEDLFGTKVYLRAVKKLKSKDGEFMVLQIDDGIGLKTLSNGSAVVLEKINKLCDTIKPSEDDVYLFKNPYRIMFESVKSTKGKDYHDIKGW